MLKLKDTYKMYGIDKLYDSEYNEVEYYRFKLNGDIQIWHTYDESKRVLYEVCDTKIGSSKVCKKLSDAMSIGLFWSLLHHYVY